MDRISPGRRRTSRVYQPLLRTWLTISPFPVNTAISNNPRRSLLSTLRHWPVSLTWMDPLPYWHRWGLLLSGGLLLFAVLWPDSATPPLPPPSSASSVMLAELPAPNAAPATLVWQSYQLQAGQTLAQLFREQHLPVNAAFAIAQVEGEDKPLSNLQPGQQVKVQQDAQGAITRLELPLRDGHLVSFILQSDGRYQRLH